MSDSLPAQAVEAEALAQAIRACDNIARILRLPELRWEAQPAEAREAMLLVTRDALNDLTRDDTTDHWRRYLAVRVGLDPGMGVWWLFDDLRREWVLSTPSGRACFAESVHPLTPNLYPVPSLPLTPAAALAACVAAMEPK